MTGGVGVCGELTVERIVEIAEENGLKLEQGAWVREPEGMEEDWAYEPCRVCAVGALLVDAFGGDAQKAEAYVNNFEGAQREVGGVYGYDGTLMPKWFGKALGKHWTWVMGLSNGFEDLPPFNNLSTFDIEERYDETLKAYELGQALANYIGLPTETYGGYDVAGDDDEWIDDVDEWGGDEFDDIDFWESYDDVEATGSELDPE